ncbi:MAG: 8-amino-7-oxononanoate synthase [Gammaproteobacteria bacterium]|nr:8-amino-7-oxononanoate synthase [Gammaproteobacteria bacterium]
MKNLQIELDQHRAQHLYRRRRISEGPQQPEMVIDGRAVLNFCSNDYLGLANHEKVKQAFIAGVKKYGAGSGAAHLVNGHCRAHHALEEELAEFTGYPRALLFSTGYMANLGLAQALVGKGDSVLEDRLNHASLIDGGLLSGARFTRYAHNDVNQLEQKLAGARGEALVLSDGVFSMDGDLANLAAIAPLCRKHQAWLMVDDAHGFGVLGEHGKGCLEHFQLSQNEVPIYMATLGKALGTSGAFIAGSDALIETLIQKARPYIYTTATPPAIAEATRASLQVIQAQPEMRAQLNDNIAYFKRCAEHIAITLGDSQTAIQPIIIGEAERAVAISERLLEQGLLVTAIRPPTVPKGTARLRVTLSATHTRTQIEQLIEALSATVQVD